jgi:hypothetical protein
MVTITLDEVIRKTLNKSGLPLHYYIKYLVIARDGLKELNFSILPSENTEELVLDANNEAALPNDFVGEVAVYKSEGDKLIELPHNHLISSFNNTQPFDVVDPIFSTGESIPLYADEFRSDVGRQFGHVYPRIDGYRIITELNKIRVDNTSELEKVYLKYVTLPQKVNNKTLIHPFIEPAIVAYINWQVAEYASDRNTLVKRNEFYNQRRLAKANLNRVNISDILSSFRMYHNQAIKV